MKTDMVPRYGREQLGSIIFGNPLERVADIAVCTILIFFSSTSPSYAYLDPGTGSMLLTGILGIFAAITYTLRRYFYKILSFFRSSFTRDDLGDN